MNAFFYTMLFIFGTLLGSFSSVIIHRLKSKEGGICSGRSHCNNCNTQLKALDLIPIFSWLKNLGKCSYCKKSISKVYPILEITTGILFVSIGYFLMDVNLLIEGNPLEIVKLFFWLSIAFISIIYIFYDILFLEIHEGIMLSGITITTTILAFQTLFSNFQIISTLPSGIDNLSIGIQAIVLTIIIIVGLYGIMIKGFHEIVDVSIVLLSIVAIYIFKVFHGINIGDIAILNGLTGALGIFIFFFLQILISRGAWIGGGDLRIAIMIGLTLGITYSFAGTMLTYLIGSILSIGFIIIAKLKKTKFASEVPFGPYLAAGFFCTVFLQTEILSFIENNI